MPTTRLSELWLEQSFAGGKASLKAGQLAADAEFFFSELSTMFLQSDWPTIAAVNLPSGGAAYPLSTPGVRLKVDPIKNVSLLLAVLNGDPAGPGPGDEQLRNRYGLNFRVNDPPFIIGEAQFQRNIGKKDEGLATTLKLGGWGHFGQFNDQRFAIGGGLLADPAGSGVPIKHRGNNGLYAVIDQQLYRPKGGDSQSGISVFSRMSISPSDRNLIRRLYRRRHRVRGLDPEAARRQVRRERHLRQVLRQRPRVRPRHGAVHRRARSDPRLRDQSGTHLHGADRPGLDRAAEPAIHLASERRRDQERHRGRRAFDLAILSCYTATRVQPSGVSRSCGRKRAL